MNIEVIDEARIMNDDTISALECYQALLQNGTLADFTFVVGEKEFAVHKAILAARSPVFARMFEHEMREQIESRLELTDVEVGVFEQLLCFIYTGEVSELDKFALDLFSLADKVKRFFKLKS